MGSNISNRHLIFPIVSRQHLDSARGLLVLGEILTAQGEPARGESHLREALAIRKKCCRQGISSAHSSKARWGGSLVAQRRYAEAEPLLSESFNALKSSQGAQHPSAAEALRRLVTLYEA
jgi:hypothetical protein